MVWAVVWIYAFCLFICWLVSFIPSFQDDFLPLLKRQKGHSLDHWDERATMVGSGRFPSFSSPTFLSVFTALSNKASKKPKIKYIKKFLATVQFK